VGADRAADPARAKRGGRRRSVVVREVLNGLRYVLETGWLPMAAPAARSAAAQHGERLPAALGLGRHAAGRAPPALRRLPRAGGQGGEPHGGCPRQQVGQGGGKGGPSLDPIGFDAGKGVKGVKYHILVDTLGLLLNIAVHAASVQDRDGAALVLDHRTRALFPFVFAIFADAGYRGPRAASAARCSGRWRLRIVRRAAAVRGFVVLPVVLPKRWIVARTLAWLTRCRRLARNLENLARTSVALIRSAMITLMARRLARS
jgi:transposase